MVYREPRESKGAERVDVLLIEDSEGDIRLTREVLKEARTPIALSVARSGEEALAFLRRGPGFEEAPRPQLILLDLNIPGIGGRETLHQLKRDERLRVIPVVVLTTSTEDADVQASYSARANSYITKPIDLDEFIGVIRGIESFWLSTVALPRLA